MNGRALRAGSPGDELPAAPAFERLPDLDLPIHVVLGALDRASVRERGRRIVERVARGSLQVMPGVAHLPPLEGSRELAQCVLDFVRSIGGGTR